MKILSAYSPDYLKSVFSIIRMLPSLHIGSKNYHSLFPRKAGVILYITNRCNSRCVMCNHWKQYPKQDLSVKVIESLFNSHSVNKDGFLIEGGEGLLHPHFKEIMELFKGKRFTLLTNGVLTDRLLNLVKDYKIPSVSISLDGPPSTYKRIRGIDAYNDVLKTIELLRDKTNLAICITLMPWNTYEDYVHIKKICAERNLRLLPNIFSKMEFMGAKEKEDLIDVRFEKIDDTYVNLYNDWVEGKLVIPCFSMRFLTIIRPNGDVVLCQYKDIVLGNLYERAFGDIWNDEKTKSIQKAQRFCNNCWVSSHRAFDMKFTLLLKKILPLNLFNKFINIL